MSAAMKPILFNTEMVRAILDGRKTQTREEVAGGFLDELEAYYICKLFREGKYEEAKKEWGFETLYKVGDVLYVKEEMRIDCDLDVWYVADDEYVEAFIDDGTKPYPELDEEKYEEEYTGTVLAEDMPKEAARIFLRVTNVRVERLQDITLGDIFQEGCQVDINGECFTTNLKMKAIYSAYQKEKEVFHWWYDLWNSINGKDAWEDNPYVFVYEFKKVEKPC